MDPIRRIQSALEKGTCVPIVGAGVSIAAGVDSWRSHLKALAADLDDPFRRLADQESGDPTEVASLLLYERARLGLRPVPIRAPLPSALHRTLAGWRCRLYLTTNFDDCLERALEELGVTHGKRYYDRLKDVDLEACLDCSRDWETIVVKLCSSADSENPGFETTEDFARLVAGQSGAVDFLSTVLRVFTPVFVGCSMADPLLNAAIDRCFASSLCFPKPIALVPKDTRPERKRSLQARNVQLVEFEADLKEKRLNELLLKCKQVPTGEHRLLVFEPGTIGKLKQVLDAVDACGNATGISSIGVVTADPSLIEAFNIWSEPRKSWIQPYPFIVPEIHCADKVIDTIRTPKPWTAVLTPYEFATGYAAAFAERYCVRIYNRALRVNTVEAANLSRNKSQFKKFLQLKFATHQLIRPTLFESIDILPDLAVDDLLKIVTQASLRLKRSRLVVKPVDAGGSIGVRPVDLTDLEESRCQMSDLLGVLHSMPVESETRRCDTSRIIIEERLEGEEFSVESRYINQQIDSLAVHWKVDIDSDGHRFFERLFVTLPSSITAHKKLVEGNNALLKEMGVGPGVFHAEYRMSRDLKKIYPLEVGLRPGGGMVNYSVSASCGIDLYEAAIRCALGVEMNPVLHEIVVATGLIFATQAGGGVLPTIRFSDEEDEEESLALVGDDMDSIKDRLQFLIDTTDRQKAKGKLLKVLDRDNELCRNVREAMHDLEERGLRATIDFVELWLRPGKLITEEEASYVGGLRIKANINHDPIEAMAETVAAMHLCLESLRCKPDRPLQTFGWKSAHLKAPRFWSETQDTTFRSDFDAWTFSRALSNLPANEVTSVLDLGCGSAKPALPLIDSSVRYAGIDIVESAVRQARANILRIPNAVYQLECGDVNADDWLPKIQNVHERWDAVVSNLPYLPGPKGVLNVDVDGGPDGLRFIPERPIEIAKKVGAKFIVINVSSLCDLGTFSDRLKAANLGVVKVVATVAPLEHYANSVLHYIRQQTFAGIFESGNDPRQIIYSFTLASKKGISLRTTIKQINSLLNPKTRPLYTMIEGDSKW